MKLQITIPTTLEEVTLEKYQKFLSIAKDNPDGDFLQHKMVEIFCGIDLKNAAKISYKDVNEITTNLSNLFNQKYDLKRTFKLGDTEFGFITNLDEITLGEYTDLDKYISDWDMMHNAMAVLYRPITKKLKDKYQIEEYNGSYTYCNAMKFMPVDVALGAVVFLQFRQRIVEVYDTLFGGQQAVSEYSKQSQFGSKWGWYSSFYALAQGDVRRFEDISRIRLSVALTFLTFEKEKNQIEIELIRSK